MFTKFVVAFSILAIAAAIAGTVPVTGIYKVTLSHPSVIMGTELKAGEYRIKISADKVVFSIDNESHEIPAKVETATKKFETTEVRYQPEGSRVRISAIGLGGTTTQLLFN